MGVAGLEPELAEVAGVEGDGSGDGDGERYGLADGEELGSAAGAFAPGFESGDIEGQGGGGEGAGGGSPGGIQQWGGGLTGGGAQEVHIEEGVHLQGSGTEDVHAHADHAVEDNGGGHPEVFLIEAPVAGVLQAQERERPHAAQRGGAGVAGAGAEFHGLAHGEGAEGVAAGIGRGAVGERAVRAHHHPLQRVGDGGIVGAGFVGDQEVEIVRAALEQGADAQRLGASFVIGINLVQGIGQRGNSGWPATDVGSGGVDATSVTRDKEGNLYFGLLTANYSDP